MFSSSLLSVQREETAGEFLEQLLHLPEQITLSILAHLLCSKVPCPAINQDILIPSLSWFLINFMRKIQKDKEEENQKWWGRGTTFFSYFPSFFPVHPCWPTYLQTHLSPDQRAKGSVFAHENKLVYPLHVGFAYESPPGAIPGIFCACVKTIPRVGWIWDERCFDRSCNFRWNCFRTYGSEKTLQMCFWALTYQWIGTVSTEFLFQFWDFPDNLLQIIPVC